ncbi:MAG TPA: alpha/beta fold hydrolase [Vicinamibacterales bacterium]
MSVTEQRIAVSPTVEVTARRYPASPSRQATLVLAHGAGAGQTHPFMVGVATALAAEGIDVVTFNFPYVDAGRRTPDRAPVLEQTWRAVLAHVAAGLAPGVRLVAGGKSMGGRIASQVLATDPEHAGVSRVSGLVLLGYPLHPPGKPDQLRTAHLPALATPILLVQGTRDAFGTRDEVEPIFAALPTRVDFLFIEGGDHGFAVPRSSGRTSRDVMRDVTDRVAGWILG